VQTDPPPTAPRHKIEAAVTHAYWAMVRYRIRRNLARAAYAEAQMNKLLDYLSPDAR
jgi:hypothetical protein